MKALSHIKRSPLFRLNTIFVLVCSIVSYKRSSNNQVNKNNFAREYHV